MAINFESANTAGYNNHKIVVFPATVKIVGNSAVVVSAPSNSTITNTIKSGDIPFVSVTTPMGYTLLPFTSIAPDGSYTFSASVYTDLGGTSKALLSLVVNTAGAEPLFRSSSIS